ncbi:uncharacterized protein LOC106177917 [Lingula anatina]|uniref:Uncharacterized protein LOC106177917 n=1 Tax=Lingula anatina TaxID=7574 RepID=A0A1S3K1P1_LINAN|nr:uncharacterized protein LOC106177917 [Lingula anatina]|eukprot:XP_013416314.1 uncharacterized protein LOC106177917 [Lingula anatina]
MSHSVSSHLPSTTLSTAAVGGPSNLSATTFPNLPNFSGYLGNPPPTNTLTAPSVGYMGNPLPPGTFYSGYMGNPSHAAPSTYTQGLPPYGHMGVHPPSMPQSSMGHMSNPALHGFPPQPIPGHGMPAAYSFSAVTAPSDVPAQYPHSTAPARTPAQVSHASHLNLRLRQTLQSALTLNTNRTYQQIERHLQEFSHLTGLCAFPADATVTALFTQHLAEKYRASSIRTYMAALSYKYKMDSLPDPTKSFIVQQTLKGLVRQMPSQDTRLPITVPILHTLLQNLRYCLPDSYEILMYQAMFTTAFFGLLRVSEITTDATTNHTLKVENIDWDYSSSAFTLRFTSFKHSAPSSIHRVRLVAQPVICPVISLTNFLHIRPTVSNAPLFIHRDGSPVTRSQFTRTLDACLLQSGLNSARIRSHSFRIGGRPYLRRLIDLTMGVSKAHHHIRLNKEVRADLNMWRTFLLSFNGRGFFHEEEWTNPNVLHLYTDASSTKGFGACFGNLWFYGHWPPEAASLHITILECYPIVAAFLLWQDHFRDKKVLIHSDNGALIFILNKCKTKDPILLKLLRKLILICLQKNILHKAEHIPGEHNTAADSLSRFDFQTFRRSIPTALPQPEHLPRCLMPATLIFD